MHFFLPGGVAFCILSAILANRGIRPHSLRKVNRNGINQIDPPLALGSDDEEIDAVGEGKCREDTQGLCM